ncbi:undecaprenyl-diphosphate phosphatase [Bacteriovorax sp. Seq25_V]|uniref:undecaprenyl-diphosphate phosphatase n=1 Tax=Bacteriovorax sp. Seq25_V TaxID=1201288 RepID=UPI00038A4BF9|nr:undecaprenyl-diphosphate phosphatase [Bacteriovorax sp. Seq25_V]EQC48077.1 putative undecaprenyl-diphosphatase UppP [Bacteriovorax sp. Seq25_V]
MTNLYDIFFGVIYGLIQGLSEFLPVSSSGHLALFPKLAHFKDPGLIFDLAMHVGTALAVSLYFHKELLKIGKSFFMFIAGKSKDMYGTNFVIATFFSGVLALILKDFAQEVGRHSGLIAFNLAFFGVLLYLSDKYFAQENSPLSGKSGVKVSILIGLAQVLAIFPGVSRSGITITAARVMKLDRHDASSFSFLLSLPLILAGAALKFYEIRQTGASFSMDMCIIGMIVSFVTGLVTIHYFMKLIRRINFCYFMYYRIFIAILVVILT